MIDYLSSPVIHEAFFKKYASKKFLKGKYYHPGVVIYADSF
jgi:G2/mitotic-specific cyclin 1/2